MLCRTIKVLKKKGGGGSISADHLLFGRLIVGSSKAKMEDDLANTRIKPYRKLINSITLVPLLGHLFHPSQRSYPPLSP